VTPPAAAPAIGSAAPRARPAPGMPRRPRRVSGPARRSAPATAPGQRSARPGALLLRLLSALERLASHPLLDRLLRGRAWIGLVTFALIGIVTLQLTLLKLNGTVGRALERAAQLQRENASLSIENSEVAAADRVQKHGAQMGMEFATSRALSFLTADPGVDFTRGAAALSAPARSASSGEGAGGASSAEGAAEGGPGEGGEGRTSEASASSGASSQASPNASEGTSAPASRAPEGAEGAQPQTHQSEAGSAPATAAGGSEAGPSG
jgi:hypothetical protein